MTVQRTGDEFSAVMTYANSNNVQFQFIKIYKTTRTRRRSNSILLTYSRTSLSRTVKGNTKKFEIAGVRDSRSVSNYKEITDSTR